MVDNGKHVSCYGCGVCAVACPYKAIGMIQSQEGFWVPEIDPNLCVGCNVCDKVCAYLSHECTFPIHREEQVGAYAVVNKNEKIRQISTSGGAGYAIATYLRQQGYTLVGVKYDESRGIACHFATDSLEEFRETMNSKYLPSYTVDGFSTLLDGKKYAVFGTPCQIDSLRRWMRLRRNEEKIVFIDLFCHGVPSYLHWQAYLKHHLQGGEQLIKPVFRDKRNGWHIYTMNLQTNKRILVKPIYANDYFQNIFLGNYSLNRVCYTCKYRGNKSAADIRMGDLWGGKYAKNETGITGVLAFTPMGEEIISGISGKLCDVAVEKEEVVQAGQLHHDLVMPRSRAFLLDGFRQGKSLPWLYLRYVYKMWLKNLVPYKVKCLIKQLIYKCRIA